MAALQRLEISRLRNLDQVQLDLSPQVNIFFGDNGSGKTSVLEAIHLLGLGRSFRSGKADSVIQHQQEDCIVFAQMDNGLVAGLQKSLRAPPVLKLQGERQKNWQETARNLPLQVINAESFLLLEGSPKIRRRFLDWGVFHVEHSFINAWRSASRCLAQRNLLLKQHSPARQLSAWDHELVQAAILVDRARRDYFERFLPMALTTVGELISLDDLQVDYWRGWEDRPFEEVLENGLDRDMRYGATQRGPHRADLIVTVGGKPASDTLSRGQQKLLVSGLKIAQGRMLAAHTGRQGIYLVDDLPSELDRHNRARVCELLINLGSQIFITSVELGELEGSLESAILPRKFHVEHGKMTAADQADFRIR